MMMILLMTKPLTQITTIYALYIRERAKAAADGIRSARTPERYTQKLNIRLSIYVYIYIYTYVNAYTYTHNINHATNNNDQTKSNNIGTTADGIRSARTRYALSYDSGVQGCGV